MINAYNLQKKYMMENKVMHLVNLRELAFEHIKDNLEKIESVLYHNRHFLTKMYGRWNLVVKMEINIMLKQMVNKCININTS